MIKAVIIDDEKKSREVLKRIIDETGLDIYILNEADSVKEGYKVILKENPELVFLDIEMLDGTGFNLLEMFDSIDFDIIFTTAYDKYAIKAFRYSAIDYLLKPIDIEELEAAIARLKKDHSNKIDNNELIKSLLQNIKQESEKITIKTANEIHFVNVSDIIYLSSSSSYTEIEMLNSSKIIATKPLKYFDMLFEDNKNFFRISKSHLININFTKVYKKNSDTVKLTNGLELDVSRRKKKEFLTLFD